MQNFEEKVLKALSDYVEHKHGGNKKSASRELGLSETSNILYLWLEQKRSPTLKNLNLIAQKLEITLSLPEDNLECFEFIDKVEAKAGAGFSLQTSDKKIGRYAFRADFLALQRISVKKSVLLDVEGDSMEPLIKNGDTILVDQSDTDLRNDNIYLIGIDEELMVKRLVRIPNGWKIHSENPRVSAIDIMGADLDELRVYGRVRWFGRVL